MCTPTPPPPSKDLMEPVFQLGNPLLIQICNCESQKSLAGGSWGPTLCCYTVMISLSASLSLS